jgi:hypothetical protein
MKIFWSWQSDTDKDTGKHFVRDVLIELARELNATGGTEEADRPDDILVEEDEEEHDDPLYEAPDTLDTVGFDQDTLGVGGSPRVADKILEKIAGAAVFVADITPVATTAKGKRIPNPNVMLELGYAMNQMDNERIVLVGNMAEGAKPSRLPFDLSHWRWPVLYRLNPDATPEQIAEAAAKLKAALRPVVIPGLRQARTVMAEDDRRTNRVTDLKVVPRQSDTRSISQAIGSLPAKSLDEIKRATPLLPIPRPGSISAASPVLGGIARSSMLGALGKAPPVSSWSREEKEGYNRFVQSYYERYSAYLEELAAHQALVLRSFSLKLDLVNDGTLTATSIDLALTFPASILLFEHDLPKPPEAPSPPPLRPFGPGVAWASPIPADFSSLTRPPADRRISWIDVDNRCAGEKVAELKHNMRVQLDPIMIAFVTPADIGPFDIDYVINAREPLDPIRGQTRIEVVRVDE